MTKDARKSYLNCNRFGGLDDCRNVGNVIFRFFVGFEFGIFGIATSSSVLTPDKSDLIVESVSSSWTTITCSNESAFAFSSNIFFRFALTSFNDFNSISSCLFFILSSKFSLLFSTQTRGFSNRSHKDSQILYT